MAGAWCGEALDGVLGPQNETGATRHKRDAHIGLLAIKMTDDDVEPILTGLILIVHAAREGRQVCMGMGIAELQETRWPPVVTVDHPLCRMPCSNTLRRKIVWRGTATRKVPRSGA
jgi:hypothetical protein